MSEQEQAEMSPEDYKKQVMEQSSQVGQNVQAFLEQVKLSAKTENDRQILGVFSSIMEVMEKVASGELVILNTEQVFGPTQQPEAPVEDGADEDGDE